MRFLSVCLSITFLLFLPVLAQAQGSGSDDELLFEDDTGLTIFGTRQTSQHIFLIEREDIEKKGALDLAGLLQETLNLNLARYGPYGSQTSIHLLG
jgi:outer membrane cobalamin receptor